MQIWAYQKETEQAWIKEGHAADVIIKDMDHEIRGLYEYPKDVIVESIFHKLRRCVSYSTLWLAGVLQIAAEITLPDGITVREYKRKLFSDIYVSVEARNRILYIAANHIFDFHYDNDVKDSRRHVTSKNGKLNGQQAKDIRQRFKRGLASQLAAEYGVSEKAIYNIVNRETWKHV